MVLKLFKPKRSRPKSEKKNWSGKARAKTVYFLQVLAEIVTSLSSWAKTFIFSSDGACSEISRPCRPILEGDKVEIKKFNNPCVPEQS